MDELSVPAGERGVIRVFALDGDPTLFEPMDAAPALGLRTLDPAGVEVFARRDVADIGLAGYLLEGQGVAPGTVTEADLAEVGAAVVLVRSRAFAGPVTLTPRAPLRFVGAWREADAAAVDPVPLATAAARPGGPLESAPGVDPVQPTGGRSWSVLAGAALAVLVLLAAVWLFGGTS